MIVFAKRGRGCITDIKTGFGEVICVLLCYIN